MIDFLVVEVLWWGEDELLGVVLQHELGVFGILHLATSDQTIRDNTHNPHHPEENADTASENECDCATFPRAKSHEGLMDAPCERVTMDDEMMSAVLSPITIHRSGMGEGEDTEKTTVVLVTLRFNVVVVVMMFLDQR